MAPDGGIRRVAYHHRREVIREYTLQQRLMAEEGRENNMCRRDGRLSRRYRKSCR